MLVDKDLFKVMRAGKRPKKIKDVPIWAVLALYALGIVFVCLMTSSCALASPERNMTRPNCFPLTGYTCADIVEAIGKAENSKSHPYGIMKKYKYTDPWQACMNTVKHNVMNYIHEGEPNNDFIHYLSLHYAPISAANDPKHLNANWERNVKHFLLKG